MGLILDPTKISSWKPVIKQLSFNHKSLIADKFETEIGRESYKMFELAMQATPERNWQEIWRSVDTDKDIAERSLFTVYDLIGFPKPEVRWIDSPLEGFRQMERERAEMMFPYFQQCIRSYLAHGTKLNNHTKLPGILSALLERVSTEVFDRPYAYKHYFTEEQQYKGPNRGFSALGCGIFDYPVCQLYDQMFKSQNQHESMQPFCELSANCGFWFAAPDLSLLSHKPIEFCFRFNDPHLRKVLHKTDGPAIRFADGFGVYFINDFAVSKKVALGDFGVGDILKEDNLEVRRIMTERMGGTTAVLKKLKLPVAHQDEFGILYRASEPQLAERLRSLFGNMNRSREDFCAVQVFNSTPEEDGSRREFLLRVPPTCQTAKDAVLWTGGIYQGNNLEIIAET